MKRSVLVLCLAAGCTATDPTPGNQALGITEFQITNTSTEVNIVGLNAQHDHVAEASLTLGRVILAEEGLDGPGRTLTVRVLGKEANHRSVGMAPVTLPHLRDPNLVTFLSDPHVAMALAARGVTFTAQAADSATAAGGDRPLYGCTYQPSCTPTSCQEISYSDGSTFEYLCCPDATGGAAFIDRSCSGTSHSACGLNGPKGCAVCWSENYYVDCETGTIDDGTEIGYDVDYQGPNYLSNWECEVAHDYDGNWYADGNGYCFGGY